MKLQLLATALIATTACARSSIFAVYPAADDSLKVPGENPLSHCEDPKDDLLSLTTVDLTPNPPKAGHSLFINGTGSLSKKVDDGAYLIVSVKYGLIRIINKQLDLCENVGEVDLKCPLDKDEVVTLTKEVELPSQIPPGKYTVQADVYTKDDEKVTCLTGQVEFHLGGSSSSGNKDTEIVPEPKQGL